MKKVSLNYRAVFAVAILVILFLVAPIKVFAVENPLDEIQDYTIQIDM